MADFPKIEGSDPFADDPGFVDAFDMGQVNNFVIGINRGVDGYHQAIAEVKEALGLEDAGYADFVTQELQREQGVLRDAAYDDQQLPGAGGAEFAGEVVPLLAIPLGGTPLRAAGLGGAASAGFFHEEGSDASRLGEIAFGAATGGLLKRLLMGGKAKGEAEVAIKETEQLFLPAPPQRAEQKLLTDQRQLMLPRPQPRAHSPKAPRMQGLTADDFQNAGPDTIARMGVAPVSPVPRNNASRAFEAIQRGGSDQGFAARQAVRKTSVAGVNAERRASRVEVEQAAARLEEAEAKLVKLQTKLKAALKKAPAKTKPKVQKALTNVTKNKLANRAISRAISGKPLKKVVPGARKAAAQKLAETEAPAVVSKPVRSLAAAKKDPRVSDIIDERKQPGIFNDKPGQGNGYFVNLAPGFEHPDLGRTIHEATVKEVLEQLNEVVPSKSKTLGKKQGGFINTDAQALASGAAVGGVVGGAASDGDPLAVAAGVVGGAALGRAAARRLDPVVTNKMKADMRKASADGGEYVGNISRLVKAKDLSGEAFASVRTEGPRVLDQFLGATMTRIENLAPAVAAALSRAEFQQHYISGQWIQEGNKAFAKIKDLNLTDVQARKFKIAMLNSTKGGKAYLRGIGKSDEAVTDLEAIFSEAGDYLKEVSLGKNLRKNYMARMVVDTSAFEGIEVVDTYLAQLAKKKGIKLTEFEKEVALTEAINGALTHTADKTSWGKAAANLQRRTNKVTEKNVDAYADLQHGFNDYAEQVTTQVERRRFFKGQNVKVDDLGPNSENIDSVAERLRKELSKGNLSPAAVDEVAQLIRMRFGPGEQAPHKFWQNFKNLTYMGLLGNPLSAMTQFGDIALSAHRNGIANTASSVIEQIANRGQAVRGLDKETLLGIRNAAADFASRTPTRDALNWALKYSGFQAVDKFGKNTFIASALKRNRQMDKDTFTKKWAEKFDPEAKPGGPTPRTDELYKKVQSFEEINDANKEDIGFMLWNELSGVQPIALSALPERYLRHPDGRTAYMLQSFTLKLFDVMRKDIYNQATRGNYRQATINAAQLTTLFVSLNGTVDSAKDFILGREQELDEVVLNNFLKMTGANKFMIDDAARNGLGQAALKLIAPPTVLLDAATDSKDALKLVPLVGKVMESRIADE